MKKQTIIILTAVILVVVAAIVCFTPQITRFDEVMTAAKLLDEFIAEHPLED